MVFTIGETVLDIIFKTINDVKMKPGGSMLNTAISLGRLGIKTCHISTLSNDKASDLLIHFMNDNSVDSSLIFRSNKTKTSLALAYLDELNNADYTFYKDDLNLKDSLVFPKPVKSDIVHFGSFFSLNRNVHTQLHAFLAQCKNAGATTVYDPNFRKPHLPMLPLLMPLIEKNFKAATIVKASDEDFEYILSCKTGMDAWEKIKGYGVKVLFYTKGAKGAEVYTNEGVQMAVLNAPISVVSSIGAGDTFSAGVIYFLTQMQEKGITLDQISMADWVSCLNLAITFAAQTCQSMENYLSEAFCKEFKYVQ